jgi:hypothetical protein
MDSYTLSLAELEARLAKLERESRECGHPSATLRPAMPAAAYDTLVVHRLELRDKAGELRGLWTVTHDDPLLALLDAAGKSRN